MYAYKIKQFAADTRGATAMEYAVGAAFIVSAVVGVIGAVGTTIKAESYATIVNGKVVLASSEKELTRIAARSSSDPIQTGSTSGAADDEEEIAPRARKPRAKVSPASATPFCNSDDDVRPCKLDLSSASFQGWRGTMLEWSQDHDADADH